MHLCLVPAFGDGRRMRAHVIPQKLVIPAKAGSQYAGKVKINSVAAYWVARA